MLLCDLHHDFFKEEDTIKVEIQSGAGDQSGGQETGTKRQRTEGQGDDVTMEDVGNDPVQPKPAPAAVATLVETRSTEDGSRRRKSTGAGEHPLKRKDSIEVSSVVDLGLPDLPSNVEIMFIFSNYVGETEEIKARMAARYDVPILVTEDHLSRVVDEILQEEQDNIYQLTIAASAPTPDEEN